MPHLSKIYNKRILQLFDELKADGKPARDICRAIKMPQSILSMVRADERSFTIEQITAMCRYTGVSADWVLGLSDAKKHITKVITNKKIRQKKQNILY